MGVGAAAWFTAGGGLTAQAAAASRKKSPSAGAGGGAASAAGSGEQQQQQQQARRLTQQEMLAEAAMTEVANLADLDVLLAQEEEVKRKAHAAARAAYRGPRLRTVSRIVDGREQVSVFSFSFRFPSLSPSSPPLFSISSFFFDGSRCTK